MTFKNTEAVEKALKMNRTKLDNRELDIQKAKGEKNDKFKNPEELKNLIKGSEIKTIFVKNLPYDCKEEELGDFFKPCGKIENVRFVYNSATNKFKGFAYIDFKNTTSLFAAV